MSSRDVGRSSPLATTFLFALAVTLATTVGGGFYVLTDSAASAPTVSASDATLTTAPDGTQTVAIRERAGEAVPVSDLAITVVRPDGAQTTVTGFPHPNGSLAGCSCTRGDDVVTAVGGPLESGGTWQAGEALRLHLATDDGSAPVPEGESLHVRVVHRPSNVIVLAANVSR
ncbi:hypothetical protein [Halarchaeum sp. P4]|uniref:hypothetical protein n=1 Tax=Halarchaeum sp. P4 TaxID=3421639 RepID=UPI003EBE87DF